MLKIIKKLSFFVSDVACCIYMAYFMFLAIAYPLMMPVYEKMANLPKGCMLKHLSVSALALCCVYLLYKITKRHRVCLVIFSLMSCAVYIFATGNDGYMVLLPLSVFWLPVILDWFQTLMAVRRDRTT